MSASNDYKDYLFDIAFINYDPQYDLSDAEFNRAMELKAKTMSEIDLLGSLVDSGNEEYIAQAIIRSFNKSSNGTQFDKIKSATDLSSIVLESLRETWFDEIYEEFEAQQEKVRWERMHCNYNPCLQSAEYL